MSVGEIVERVDVGQSTVSHHLSRLAEAGFVLSERRGTSTYFAVNERCLECFPTAADLVMGRVPALDQRSVSTPVLPWLNTTAA